MIINVEQIEKKYKELIDMAKDMMKDCADVRHSMEHIEDVVINTIEIIKRLPDNTNIDVDACIISAYWHDVGRKIQSEEHGRISADILKIELEKRKYDRAFIETCYNAIAFHTMNINDVENDKIPETMEAKIIKDADKIAFVGIGRWKHSINENKRFKTITNSMFSVRNKILALDVSKEIWDIRVLELIVFLHDEVFKNK